MTSQPQKFSKMFKVLFSVSSVSLAASLPRVCCRWWWFMEFMEKEREREERERGEREREERDTGAGWTCSSPSSSSLHLSSQFVAIRYDGLSSKGGGGEGGEKKKKQDPGSWRKEKEDRNETNVVQVLLRERRALSSMSFHCLLELPVLAPRQMSVLGCVASLKVWQHRKINACTCVATLVVAPCVAP